MHPSKTQPCVICGELEKRIRKVDVWVDDVGVTVSKYGVFELEKHKRICNVHRVWIGGRG